MPYELRGYKLEWQYCTSFCVSSEKEVSDNKLSEEQEAGTFGNCYSDRTPIMYRGVMGDASSEGKNTHIMHNIEMLMPQLVSRGEYVIH